MEDAARKAGAGAATAFRWPALARAGDPRYAVLADLARKSRRKGTSAFPTFEWPAAFRELVGS